MTPKDHHGATHTCQLTREMSTYTHFRHFSLLHTHLFHIFSVLNLHDLLDNLVGLLKYALTLIFSLILRLVILILGFWGWQVWVTTADYYDVLNIRIVVFSMLKRSALNIQTIN